MTNLLHVPNFEIRKPILTESEEAYLDKIDARVKTVTDRYARVDTRQLISETLDTLRQAGYADVGVSLRYGRAKSTLHYIVYTLHDMEFGIDGGIKARIIQRNSYNGECGLTVRVGLLRLVCTNGLIGGKNFFEEYVRHLKGETFNNKIGGLQPAIAAALSAIRNHMIDEIVKFQSTELSPLAAQEILAGLNLSKRMSDAVTQQLRYKWIQGVGRVQDRPQNLWTFYNIVNEVIRLKSRTSIGSTRKNETLFDEVGLVAKQVLSA